MSDFGSFNDGSFQLKTEGDSIRLEFKKGVPVSGQGTVEWNIPSPAQGCATESPGEYAGMVIVLGTSPVTAKEIPQDGKVYIADPTADFDLHVGDKIGSAIVVGAIYECEEKANDEELTTTLVISDLLPNTPYYIAGYATDCQFRYHSEGTRSYSDSYGDTDGTDFPGQQVISFGSSRIIPTDGTDLVPGITYAFDLVVDRDAPTGKDFDVVEINIDGIDAGTYDDLLRVINNQIKLVNNPPQSPLPPNSGTFFYDVVAEKLWQFDGTSYTEIPAIIEATDPTVVTAGEYWYDTANEILFIRNVGNTAWDIVTTITHLRDPRTPTCADFWYNGADGKSWNGTTWCEVSTTVQATDPSICIEPECGTFWYDETNSVLNERNVETKTWEPTSAISWDDDPQALPDGTYHYDLTAQTLNIRATGAWTDITNDTGVYVLEDTPVAPVDGDLWYVPSTEILSIYVIATTSWDPIPVLVWPGDPTDVTSCELWWRTTDDVLFTWDSTNNEWDEVAVFVISTIDPAANPVIALDSLWYDTTLSVLSKWDGSGWEAVDTIEHPTDPTIGVDGEIWIDTTTNTMSVWGAGIWTTLDPIDAADDPTVLPNGTYWYDTTNNALFVRNGVTWITVAFTTVPLIPKLNDRWYDTANDILYEWNGSAYTEINGIAKASINSKGQIVFVAATGGSGSVVLIPIPTGVTNAGSGGIIIGSGFADFGEEGVSPSSIATNATLSGEADYPTRDILPSGFLWENVMPAASVLIPKEGTDGKSGLPSYDVLGVGDDGTPDERRELADSLRAQLGHPVVTVELTPFQIDTAIQGALESLRKRSSMAYKRGFFFLDVSPGQSRYQLTNRRIGYNRIVSISAINRFTSAFLSTAHGAGVYGQVVLQHLYNMGTYDLTSFHLVSQYVEQLEHLFATRIVYHWDEADRNLDIFQSFTRHERMLLDCSVERTEQELLKDRYLKSWIERYALSECQYMLAHIRGKYGSLPGAGGGISLNASELIAQADSNRQDLMDQLDDFIVQDVEDLGMHSTFIIG